ncbi:site-specific integrase [Paenibacillus kobensis]|uniref:site-specific integrase n=1 Tax=Paenibacillus kobensis TaxID=59841 RepID=UPI000FDCDBCF|nr:site-specific integrase [Paenibacillus kobensis]
MVKIRELIEDFKLNQEVLGRDKKYIDLCIFRLNRWEQYTVSVLGISEIEDVTQLHIKKYIKERQSSGSESNSTINNNIATLKVFFQYLVNEEFIAEQDNPLRRVRNLKEEKKVIVTFNDDEVSSHKKKNLR